MRLPALLLSAVLAAGPVLPIDTDTAVPTGDRSGTWDHVFTHDELAEIRAAGGLTPDLRRLLVRRTTAPAPRATARTHGGGPAVSTVDAPAHVAALAARHFAAADVPWALATIGCETGWTWDPNIVNRGGSGASGYFQHMPAYWAERSAAAGYSGASIFDPDANVAVGAWLYYTDGPGHWPVCGR